MAQTPVVVTLTHGSATVVCDPSVDLTGLSTPASLVLTGIDQALAAAKTSLPIQSFTKVGSVWHLHLRAPFPHPTLTAVGARIHTAFTPSGYPYFDPADTAHKALLNDHAWSAENDPRLAPVPTMAALRALEAPLAGAITLQGYYAAGDKPPVQYRWDPTSTAEDDGGAVIELSSSPVSGRYLLCWDGHTANVRDWGAPGAGGATDNLPAINAAIAALPTTTAFNSPVDGSIQQPGTGATGAYHIGKIIVPPGDYPLSDTLYLSPAMELELVGNLFLRPGAAPDAAQEKFCVQCLYGQNTITNPNTSFGIRIHGSGSISAGSKATNPGGSGLLWLNANYGVGLTGIIIGECALRGIVATVQGGNIDGVWTAGPIWRGPALHVMRSEQLVIGRISAEHANPSKYAVPVDDAWPYLYDPDGDAWSAVRIEYSRNVTAGNIQCETTPLALKIKDSQAVTICSLFDNAQQPLPPDHNSGMVRITGDSYGVSVLGINSNNWGMGYMVYDTSHGGSRKIPLLPADSGTHEPFGKAGRGAYFQDFFSEGASFGTVYTQYLKIYNQLLTPLYFSNAPDALATKAALDRTNTFAVSSANGANIPAQLGATYLINSSATMTIALPDAAAATGDRVTILGHAGGWKASSTLSISGLASAATNSAAATTNGGGYIQSTYDQACVELVCFSTGAGWQIVSQSVPGAVTFH